MESRYVTCIKMFGEAQDRVKTLYQKRLIHEMRESLKIEREMEGLI